MDAIREIETTPAFERWLWLAGALQQHHYALALLMELLLNPQRMDAPRIQQGLDYAFEPPNLPPLERVRWTVTRIRDRMKIYMDAKKLRAPVSLMEQLRLGRAVSEPSERASSAEAYASSEGTSAISMAQSSDFTQESVSSYFDSEAPQLPVSSSSHAPPVPALPSDTQRSRPPTKAKLAEMAANKDIMDLDWVSPAPQPYPPQLPDRKLS